MKKLCQLSLFLINIIFISTTYHKDDQILASKQLLEVADFAIGQHYSNDIASLGNGIFGISYVGADQSLYAAFMRNGEFLPGSPSKQIPQGAGNIQASAVCQVNDNQMMVVYTLYHTLHQVFVRLVNIDGTFASDEVLATHVSKTSTVGRCRQLQENTVFVHYGVSVGGTDEWNEHGRVYNINTHSFGTAFMVNDRAQSSQTYGFTAKINDNKFIHVFSEYYNQAVQKGVWFQELDKEANKIGSNIFVQNSARTSTRPKVALTDNEYFMIAYSNSDSEIHIALYNENKEWQCEKFLGQGIFPDIQVYEGIAYIAFVDNVDSNNQLIKGLEVNTQNCEIVRPIEIIDNKPLNTGSVNQALSFNGITVLLGIFYRLAGTPPTLQYTEFMLKQITPCNDTKCIACYTDLNSCPMCDGSTPEARLIRQRGSGDCSCIDGYFDDNSSLDCIQCQTKCGTCDNLQSCISCADINHRLLDCEQNINCPLKCKTCNGDNTCSECFDQSKRTPDCEQDINCPEKCKECDSSNKCLSCTDSLLRSIDCLQPFQCPVQCNTCLSDKITCETCFDNSKRIPDCVEDQNCPTKCLYCTSDNISCSVCTNDTLRPPECEISKDCPQKCKSCNLDNTCQECLDSDYKVPDCTELICPLNCLSCNSISGVCEICKNNMIAPDCQTQQIFQASFSITLPDGTIQQQTCDPVCNTCEDQKFNCASCLGQNRLTYQQCQCQEGYHDQLGTFRDCIQCSQYCSTCNQIKKCSSCKPNINRQLNKFTQICECQKGYFEDQDSNCIKCFMYQGVCFNDCPINTIKNEQLQQCEELSYKLQSNSYIIFACGICILIIQILIILLFRVKLLSGYNILLTNYQKKIKKNQLGQVSQISMQENNITFNQQKTSSADINITNTALYSNNQLIQTNN